MTANMKNPGAGGRRGSRQIAGMRALYGQGHDSRLPANWRDRLPDPGHYYRQHVAKLGKAHGNGWAQGQCPFHEDRNASMSVNMSSARGAWKCFAGCGSGDLVSFHMRLTGLAFKEAARELVEVRA